MTEIRTCSQCGKSYLVLVETDSVLPLFDSDFCSQACADVGIKYI